MQPSWILSSAFYSSKLRVQMERSINKKGFNTSHLIGQAQRQLWFLRKLREAHTPEQLQIIIYHSPSQCLLTYGLRPGKPAAAPGLTSCGTGCPEDHWGWSLEPGHSLCCPTEEGSYLCHQTNYLPSSSLVWAPLPSEKPFQAIWSLTNIPKNGFFPRDVVFISPPQIKQPAPPPGLFHA